MDLGKELEGSFGATLHRLLNIHLVFTEICKYLELQDLLSCCVLSRLWCERTRDYILKRRRCRAQVSRVNPCLDLRRLDEFLRLRDSSLPFPFNGFGSSHFFGSVCTPDAESLHATQEGSRDFEEQFPSLFTELRVKHVDLTILHGGCPIYAGCLVRLVEVNRPFLETVSAGNVWGELEDLGFAQTPTTRDTGNKAARLHPMPSLKEIIFREKCKFSWDIQARLQELLACTPNLRAIRGLLTEAIFYYNSGPELSKCINVLFKQVEFCPGVDFHAVQRSGQFLSSLHLDYVRGNERVSVRPELLDLLTWEPAILPALRNSHGSLRKMTLTFAQLLYITDEERNNHSAQFLPLLNLGELNIQANSSPEGMTPFLELLREVDFSKSFPVLFKVVITLLCNPYLNDSELLQQCPPGGAVKSPSSRCLTVKALQVYPGSFYDNEDILEGLPATTFSLLTQMFPNVESFHGRHGLLLRHIGQEPMSIKPLEWMSLRALHLETVRFCPQLWENTFVSLAQGLRTLCVRVPKSREKIEYERSEDGYHIPFISTELGEKIAAEHPGLVITVSGSERRLPADNLDFHISRDSFESLGSLVVVDKYLDGRNDLTVKITFN